MLYQLYAVNPWEKDIFLKMGLPASTRLPHQRISAAHVAVLIICLYISTIAEGNTIHRLGKLKLNPQTVTVSGFSAGSSMATQFHVAHSSEIHGAALFSQAFYRCGPKSLIEFGIRCSSKAWNILPYNVNAAIQDARIYSRVNLIDNVRNLQHDKVFIWTGEMDEYLSPATVIKNEDFYKAFIKNPKESIKLTLERAKHLFPTDNFGAGCTESAEHNLYLGNCNYSGAEHALTFLLGNIQGVSLEEKQSDQKVFDEDQLKVFDQTEFYIDGNITKIGMGAVGHIYIPKICSDGSTECQLHFNFHGCEEWPLDVARRYVLNNGFLPIAERNRIVVVFPLTTAIPNNYNGCWDFFSYTNGNFATKDGEQIQVVYRMLKRLVSGI